MWIELHQTLADHPKTRKLARQLECSIPTAAGHLVLLWSWALDHAFDGDLTGWDSDDIALAAKWDGDPETFIKALLEARGKSGHGFLEQSGERLLIHDWLSYTAHLRARRESAQKANHVRWHSKRNAVDPSCEWCRTPDVSEPNPNGEQSESTVPNRTVPNRTSPSTPGDDDVDKLRKHFIAEGFHEQDVDAGLSVFKRRIVLGGTPISDNGAWLEKTIHNFEMARHKSAFAGREKAVEVDGERFIQTDEGWVLQEASA